MPLNYSFEESVKLWSRYYLKKLFQKKQKSSSINKTKYFCSDSMMKYALREGLERAKRELRES